MRVYSDRFHVGAPTHVGPLSFFPVWSQERPDFNHRATIPSRFQIGELDDAQVSRLQLANQSNTAVLVAEGTILRGGLQTRVLQNDVIIGAGQSMPVEVRCVEQGRWGQHEQGVFAGRAPVAVLSALRGLGIEASISDGRFNRDPENQGQVWANVSRYERHYGMRQTSSLEGIVNGRDDDRVMRDDAKEEARVQRSRSLTDRFAAEIEALAAHPIAGQNGVIIGISGQPVSLEIFHHEAAFRAQVPFLMRAALVDMPMASGELTPSRRAVRFAESIMDSALEFDPSCSGLMFASNQRVDIRSMTALDAARPTIHTCVLNRRHELVLAA